MNSTPTPGRRPGLAALEIDEAWWPGVLRHLRVLIDNAALVEAVDTTEARP